MTRQDPLDTYEIEMLPKALADLQAGEVRYGIVWGNRMLAEIRALEHLPRLSALLSLQGFEPDAAAELEAMEVRQKVVGVYLIWFTVDDEALRVTVLRIWPAKRQRRAFLLTES